MTPRVIRLAAVPSSGDGVAWSVSPGGFHANLVVLGPGGAIAPHRNDEIDVLVVVIDGAGWVTVDDGRLEVSSGEAVVIPRGAERSIGGGEQGLRYLTVHAERPSLSVGPTR